MVRASKQFTTCLKQNAAAAATAAAAAAAAAVAVAAAEISKHFVQHMHVDANQYSRFNTPV